MIEIKNKVDCCGCQACFNICPKNAIVMKDDEEGFKYPIVDKDKCVNCGLCEQVCPNLNKKVNNTESIAYACYNKNDIERNNSSSGGIFILLAKEIIKNGGVVFGACFNEKFDLVHDYAESLENIQKFMTSKYVQSNIMDSYKKTKEFLENDRYVLFTGTPCQIEGLLNYLNKDYDKLYTQDIICHGVPSPLVWSKYREYITSKYADSLIGVNFRNKKNGWRNYNVELRYNTQTYAINHDNDEYIKAFLRNTSLRKSCYDCKFKSKNRNSDITLADYWGIEEVHPEFTDDNGISLLVIHSDKGKELFELIKPNIEFTGSNLDEAIKYNPSMIKSSIKDENRDKFFQNLNKMKFDKLVKKYTKHTSIYRRIVNKIKRILKKILIIKS